MEVEVEVEVEVAVVEADEEEAADKVVDNNSHGLMCQSIATHMAHAVIQVGSVKDQKKVTNTRLPSKTKWGVRPIIVLHDY